MKLVEPNEIVSQNAARPASQAIREKLEHIRRQHPEVSDLVDLVLPDLSFPAHFHRAYEESSVSHGIKSLVVRCLFQDPWFFRPPLELDLAFVRRVARWVESRWSPLDHRTVKCQDDIPKGLRRVLGLTSKSARTFLNVFGAVPYARFRKGLPAFERFPQLEGDFGFLKLLYECRILRSEVSAAMLKEGADTDDYRFYFDTGVSGLDVRNLLLHARTVGFTVLSPNLVQTRIPKALSARFGVTPHTVWELHVLLDVCHLVSSGIISAEGLPPGFQVLARGEDLENLPELMAEDQAHWYLTPEKSEAFLTRESEGEGDSAPVPWRAKYGTSIYFNLERMAKHLERFPDWYQRIDPARLKESILKHYAKVAGGPFLARLWTAMSRLPEEFSGIGARDLANVLYHAEYMEVRHGLDPRKYLPSVAKYKLGMREPRGTGMGLTHERTGEGSGLDSLPLLEQIRSLEARAYLLDPFRFKGTLPSDAPIYVLEGTASDYAELPPNVVRLKLRRPLRWGEDACAVAREALRGVKVEILT